MNLNCSPNTSTFLIKTLNTRGVEAIPAVRTCKPYAYLKKETASYKANRIPLKELKSELLEALEANDGEIFSYLDEMYDDYPTIDHVNELYEDEKNGGEKTLLHFAVASSNTELIECLLNRYDIDWMIEDSFNYTALELAENLGLLDMISYLISHIEGIALIPYRGHDTFIHYAAANDREDLLRIIRRSGLYKLDQPIGDSLVSPLEFALFSEKFRAADYLMKYNGFITHISLEFCYSKALEKLNVDCNSALFFVSRIPPTLYWKNLAGFDIMLLAIKENNIRLVKHLFKWGYDFNRVDYDLYATAVQLTDSFEILNFLSSKMDQK